MWGALGRRGSVGASRQFIPRFGDVLVDVTVDIHDLMISGWNIVSLMFVCRLFDLILVVVDVHLLNLTRRADLLRPRVVFIRSLLFVGDSIVTLIFVLRSFLRVGDRILNLVARAVRREIT